VTIQKKTVVEIFEIMILKFFGKFFKFQIWTLSLESTGVTSSLFFICNLLCMCEDIATHIAVMLVSWSLVVTWMCCGQMVCCLVQG